VEFSGRYRADDEEWLNILICVLIKVCVGRTKLQRVTKVQVCARCWAGCLSRRDGSSAVTSQVKVVVAVASTRPLNARRDRARVVAGEKVHFSIFNLGFVATRT